MENKQEKDEQSFKDKIKEGVSVEEIEGFTRKHLVEVFLIAAIIIATFFSNIFWSNWLSIGFAGFGAVISLLLYSKVSLLEEHLFQFLRKEDKTTQIIVGIIRLLLAFFLPFILFAELGLLAGCGYHCFLNNQNHHEKPSEPTETH